MGRLESMSSPKDKPERFLLSLPGHSHDLLSCDARTACAKLRSNNCICDKGTVGAKEPSVDNKIKVLVHESVDPLENFRKSLQAA